MQQRNQRPVVQEVFVGRRAQQRQQLPGGADHLVVAQVQDLHHVGADGRDKEAHRGPVRLQRRVIDAEVACPRQGDDGTGAEFKIHV